MKTNHKTDVLIVGAGPTGLTAAVCLSMAGFRVRVVDRGPGPVQESYATILHPATLEILGRLGLLEPLLAEGHRINRVVVRDALRVHAVADLSVVDGPYPFALSLPQDRLEQALSTVLRQMHVPIHWNRDLIELHAEPGGVKATVVEMQEIAQGYAVSGMRRVAGSEDHVEASYVIGADGINSTVRRLMGFAVENRRGGHTHALYEFETRDPILDEILMIVGESGRSSLIPVGTKRARWTFELAEDEAAEPTAEGLRGMLTSRGIGLWPQIEKLHWTDQMVFGEWFATEFARGRVWLCGDAAHQVGPFAAQSMNAGIAEAAHVASLLAELAADGDPGGAARAYDADRRAHWRGFLADAAWGLVPGAEEPWVRAHRHTITGCLPVSGRSLEMVVQGMMAVV